MTPVEVVAIIFVVGAFVAIGARFTPRDAFGVRRAPRPIDDSIGMYAIRRLRRKSTLTESDLPQPTADEIAYRIGILPTKPTPASGPATAEAAAALTVGQAPPEPVGNAAPDNLPTTPRPLPPADLLAAILAAADRPPTRPGRRRSPAALTSQRWAGGLIAAGLVVAAGLGGASIARTADGAVLDAVGTPAPSPALPQPSDAPATPEPGTAIDETGG